MERVLKLADAIWDSRSALDGGLGEIASYMFPERAAFGAQGMQGGRPGRDRIFDSTAEDANATLAAALHGLLTNPSTAWFSLHLPQAQENLEIAQWVEETQQSMLDVFNDSATGFANEVASLYLDIGPFGWGVFSSEDEAGKGIRFKTLPPHECAFSEDRHGRVNRLVRRYSMDTAEALDAFSQGQQTLPDSLLHTWREKSQNAPLAKVEIAHVVLPLSEYKHLAEKGFAELPKADFRTRSWQSQGGGGLLSGGMPQEQATYVSLYLDRESRVLLHQGLFYEFPFQVPRWSKASGDVYGRGPGWAALPDVRVLNAVSQAQLLAAEKQADPPLLAPDDGVLGKIRTYAGGITYYRPGSGDIIPLPVTGDLSAMQALRQEKQDAIRRAFLNDRILAAHNPNMTATEVLSRDSKQMLVLGPVLGRLQSEFLGPLVERVFAMLWRKGALPPCPHSLTPTSLSVRYISPIVRAQKQVEAAAFGQAMSYLAPMLSLMPQSLELFQPDTIVRHAQNIFGFPATYLKTQNEVELIRQQQQSMEQQANDNALMGQLIQAIPRQ